MREKPVLSLLAGALDAVAGGCEYEDMFRWLKTGLAGLTDRGALAPGCSRSPRARRPRGPPTRRRRALISARAFRWASVNSSRQPAGLALQSSSQNPGAGARRRLPLPGHRRGGPEPG